MNAERTETLLRSLDVADAHRIDPRRARADLHRIVASEPRQAHRVEAAATSRDRPRAARRIAVLVAAASLLTAGLIVLPGISGGDQAFASWTAAPSGMSAKESRDVAEDCRASKKDVGGSMYQADLAAAKVAISERRGAWTTVVLAGQGGFSALCITDDSPQLFGLFGKPRIGAIGRPITEAPLGPRELRPSSLGTGTMDTGNISMAAGEAGSAVVGMTYLSKTQGEVAATVSMGQFALWLPGEELRNASSEGAKVVVAYDDGTTEVRTLSF